MTLFADIITNFTYKIFAINYGIAMYKMLLLRFRVKRPFFGAVGRPHWSITSELSSYSWKAFSYSTIILLYIFEHYSEQNLVIMLENCVNSWDTEWNLNEMFLFKKNVCCYLLEI
jgi:hypothetical protein